MKPLGKYFVLCLIFTGLGIGMAQEAKLPLPVDIKALATKYQAEREQVIKQGVAKRFPSLFLDRADAMAKRGTEALNAGRLSQSAEAFRQARWQLPYQAPQVPDHVSRILGNMRLRHAGSIQAVAYSPDGARLATASRDHTVKIWDVGNGHELLTYAGHADAVRCLAFSTDGKWLASAGEEKGIKIWDPMTGKDLINIKGDGEVTTSMVFSRDGNYLITGQAGAPGQNVMAIYEAASGKNKRSVTAYRQLINSLAFNFDGSILGVGVGDGLIQLWQYPALVDNDKQPAYWSQQDPNGATFSLAFSPDNHTLGRFGADGVKLYNLPLPGAPFQVGSPRRIISNTEGTQVTCSIFSNDLRSVFTGGPDGLIKRWDTETGRLTGAFKGHNSEIKALAFNPAGNQLVSASSDFTAHIWDFDIVVQSRDFAGHEGAVWSAAFSPDGRRVVSASADGTVRVWDAVTGKTLHVLAAHAGPITVARFGPDGKTILSGGGDKLLRFWNADTGQPIRVFSGHAAPITSLDFSRDGQKIVSGSTDKSVKIWDAASGKLLSTIVDNKSIAAAVAFSPDGKQVAIGNVDQSVGLYDAATGLQQKKWQAHGGAVSGLAFSPNGQWLASGGADHLVRVWQTAHPEQKPINLVGHLGPVSAVAFRADGKHVVSAGSDQTVRLWKIENGVGKETQAYRGHNDWVTSAAFSPDGFYIVSSGVDRIVRIWEITSREIPLLAEHTGWVYTAVVSPDGQTIATGSTDKTIKIWDRNTGLERITLEGHGEMILSLAFTPDSKTLISTAFDRSLRLWDLGSGKPLPLVPGQQQAFTGMKGSVQNAQMAPDGKKLLAWFQDVDERNSLTGFDLATGAELFSFSDPGGTISSVAFSNDGRLAATGARDGSVRVLNLDKKDVLMPDGSWFLYEKGVGMGDLAFTPDNTMLVAGSDKGDVKICLVKKKETVTTIKAHAGAVIACQVSFDGKRFATAGQDNFVKLWDLASGKELRAWKMSDAGQEKFIKSIAFYPDNKQLVTGNANTTAYVLDLP